MGRALILAGGGITGIAWASGVLAGLEAGGFDTQTWDLVVRRHCFREFGSLDPVRRLAAARVGYAAGRVAAVAVKRAL